MWSGTTACWRTDASTPSLNHGRPEVWKAITAGRTSRSGWIPPSICTGDLASLWYSRTAKLTKAFDVKRKDHEHPLLTLQLGVLPRACVRGVKPKTLGEV